MQSRPPSASTPWLSPPALHRRRTRRSGPSRFRAAASPGSCCARSTGRRRRSGPSSAGPPACRDIVGMLLHSRHPMFLWWGPELIQFYNDAYLPSFGEGKHPAAMGQAGPRLLAGDLADHRAADRRRHDARQAELERRPPGADLPQRPRSRRSTGPTAIRRSSATTATIDGTLVVCTETTARVVARAPARDACARSTRRALQASDLALLRAPPKRCWRARARTSPFALCSRIERIGRRAPHAGDVVGMSASTTRGASLHPQLVPPRAAADGARAVACRITRSRLPGARWPEPVTAAFVVPLDEDGRRRGSTASSSSG